LLRNRIFVYGVGAELYLHFDDLLDRGRQTPDIQDAEDLLMPASA
jgi:hypothetical protein